MGTPISFNLITKDCPDAVVEAIRSLVEKIFREGDEVVIVDTGSTPENLESLKQRLPSVIPGDAFQLIERPDLTEDFTDKIKEWLGEACVREFVDYRGDAVCMKDFSAARQIAQDASRNPLICWIDSDDVIEEEIPGRFRDIVDKALPLEDPKLDAVFLEYLYAFGEDGECITTLKRERLFWKDRYGWKGRCHETAIPKPDVAPRAVSFFNDAGVRVVHTAAAAPHRISDIRNYVILRTEVEDAAAGRCYKDPRTLLYLGNAARGLARFAEAHALYSQFNQLSGSKEDRFNAWYYRGSMYLDHTVQRPLDALDCFVQAHLVNHEDGRGHFAVSRCFALLGRWAEAEDWYQRALSHPYDPNQQAFAIDPTQLTYHGHLIASNVAAERKDHEEALKRARLALQARPNFEQAKMNMEAVSYKAAGLAITKSVCEYLSTLKHGGPNAVRVGRQLADEWDVCPPDLEDRGIGKPEPPETRNTNLPEIVMWCGHSPEEWSTDSGEKGIGGSEKMVLILSKALQATGKVNVSVYSRIQHHKRGVDKHGVNWRHWSEFDESRPRHALICWRNPRAVTSQCPVKRRIIWNHDVQGPGNYTDEILACVDKIQFQSKYHAREFTDEKFNGKIWIARNAVELLDRPLDPKERVPGRVVFFSSPDRGLATAAHIVREASKIVRGIEFHICYGVAPWAREAFAKNNHRYIPDVNHEMSFDLYERQLWNVLDTIPVKYHGRVGFKEMSDLLRTSSVWLYPTRFPEISCMAAMEAQQHGVIPVASRYAALGETILPDVPEQFKIDVSDDYGVDSKAVASGVQALVKALNVAPDDKLRETLSQRAEQSYDVAGLAQEWLTELGVE
jgi:tetratricopeptide (TPR) repeat protein